MWIAGLRSEIEESDSTKLLFGIANRGLSFLDAAAPGSLPANVPAFSTPPTAQASEGPSTGGTVITVSGQNFEATAQLSFGTQITTNVTVAGATQINATSPPNATNGPTSLAAYFPSGWLAVAPDAFSYDPQVLQILPNAGAPTGADNIQIYGYGFGVTPQNSPSKLAAQTPLCKNSKTSPPSPLLSASTKLILSRSNASTGPAGNAAVQGGVDILDAHTGALRLRILLHQQFMADVDGMHGSFLSTDENGQRLFAITSKDGTAQNAGITVTTLANVPLGIGTLTPAQGPAAGGTTLTIRGSGFQIGTAVSIGGKTVSVAFKDPNRLTVLTPAPTSGAQRPTITNPDGESVSLDALFTAYLVGAQHIYPACPEERREPRRAVPSSAQLARPFTSSRVLFPAFSSPQIFLTNSSTLSSHKM